ncbi:MAG: cation transporter, partial [Chitinivibrionales bacterium]|nr:cation transporter [Chitinivibrionales bacterium]
NDIFSSLSAVVGIVLGLLSFPWFDPLAGAIVAGVVVKTGFSILLDSSSDLMDTLPGKLLSEQISALCAPVRGIDSVEEIHSHRFGPYIVVNLTIGVDGTLTVAEGNRIAHEVEGRLLRDMEMVRKVYVHYHPTTASISSEAIT